MLLAVGRGASAAKATVVINAQRRADDVNRAIRLITVGARPPTVKALLPSITEEAARDMYAAIHGVRAPKGRTADSLSKIFVERFVRFQASLFAVSYQRYRAHASKVDALISAYVHYMGITAEAERRICVERARLIAQSLEAKSVETMCCVRCRTEYLHNPDEPFSNDNCPLCGRHRAERLGLPEMTAKDEIGQLELNLAHAVGLPENGLRNPIN